MSLSDPMDTREVRSVMTEMENELSKEGMCLEPKFGLKYMFTVDSKVDDPRTKPPYPDGDYGSCSAFIGDRDSMTHTCKAVMKPSGGLWGPVPGDSSSIKESHPITEDSFSLGASLTTEAALGDYTLKAGPWVLDLKGEPYTVMTGMSVQEFAHSEYLEGRMSIVDVEASKIPDDPRFAMTEKSLDGAYGTSVASCPIASGISVLEKVSCN